MSEQRLTITDAALRLRASYWTTRELLLRGQVVGGRDESGHLFIDGRSLERYLRGKTSAAAAAVA